MHVKEDAMRLATIVLQMEKEGDFANVRADKVIEAMKLSLDILRPDDPLPARISDGKTEYRKRVNMRPGDAFMIDKLVFMALYVPPRLMNDLRSHGYDSGNLISAVIGGDVLVPPATMAIRGKICGGGATERSYQVVPYSLMETRVSKITEVHPGEMFIHGESVYLKCHFDGNHYVAALDGLLFMTESMFVSRVGDSIDVTVLKPEFPKVGRLGA
jgi:hypothetical protein